MAFYCILLYHSRYSCLANKNIKDTGKERQETGKNLDFFSGNNKCSLLLRIILQINQYIDVHPRPLCFVLGRKWRILILPELGELFIRESNSVALLLFLQHAVPSF